MLGLLSIPLAAPPPEEYNHGLIHSASWIQRFEEKGGARLWARAWGDGRVQRRPR